MELFEGLRSFGLMPITLRLLGAVCAGAMVGIDREMRSKKAGLKTHVLVCLGAALCVIVSECIVLGRPDITTDATRIAANVVTGVGFLCAATLFTKRNGSLHGLTTAAGLWTTAAIGLACGAGWLEVGLIAAIIVLLVFSILGRVDAWLTGISRGFGLYAMLDGYDQVPRLLGVLHAHHVHFSDLDVSAGPQGSCIVRLSAITQRLGQKAEVARDLNALDFVDFIELT